MADDDLIIRAQLRDELSRGLRDIRAELARTTAELTSLGRRGTSSVGDLDRSLRTASGTLSGLFVSGVKRGATAIGLLTGAVGVFGLKAASSIQSSRIAFDALLGSADKGEAAFKRIQAINLKSPFQLGELTKAGQDLLTSSLDADKALKVLQSLSDIAALSTDPSGHLSALANVTRQVADSGHLMGQDAMQFQQAGVNIYKEIASVTGQSVSQVRKLGEQGQISSDLVIRVLTNLEGGLGRFAGGAEKANKSLIGQFSNLKDTLFVKLSDTAGPLVDSLSTSMPKIIELVGGFVDQIGPPIFGLLGDLANSATGLLPVIAPPIAAIVGGLGQILKSLEPAMAQLMPLGPALAGAVTELVQQLLPNMPALVDLFVAMVQVLPDFVRLLGDLIPLVMPIVKLVTAMLGFEPVRKIVAGLLVGLLAYKEISTLVGGLKAFSTAMHVIGVESRFAASAPPVGSLPGVPGTSKKPKGNLLQRGAKAGAKLTVEALVLADLNAAGNIYEHVKENGFHPRNPFGKGQPSLGDTFRETFGFGDPVVPGPTMNRHMAAGGGAAGLRITSGQRNFGLRSAASGHVNGSAVDVAGPGLNRYVQRVREQGGWATLEGAGKGMHAHADFGDPPRPGGRSTSSSTGTAAQQFVVNFNGPINGIDDLRAVVLQLFREIQRDDRERDYRSLVA